MADLDSILSGKGAVASEPETTEKETPAVAEQAQAEQVTEQTEQTGREGDQGQKMVPHEALHAEKQKVKRYTEQVASFEKTLADREAAWERRFTQLLETVKPKEPEQKAPEFWDDPSAFVKSQLDPVQKQIQTTREQTSHLMAIDKFGEEAVSEAYQALAQELQRNPAARADYQAIMGSVHPYGALVQWHQRAKAQAEIGSDPEAYKAKLRDELKAEILAEMQGGNQQQSAQAQQAAPVMPSNLAGARNVGSRSGPAWAGPTPLTDIFDRRPGK